jgi:lysozyme family protein
VAEFNKVKDVLLIAEGGESDNPNDVGGLTKFGISQHSYPNVDIVNLTFDEACLIYQRDFWNKENLDSINYQAIANQIFLLAINVGIEQSIKLAQKALNSSMQFSITVDGVLGPVTMNAINNSFYEKVSLAIRVEAISFYLKLTDENTSQIPFLRSWIRRTLL